MDESAGCGKALPIGVALVTAAEFADLLRGRPSGRKWQARCPAHNDQNPSLSIAEGEDGRILVHCWAGCTAVDVLNALGLSMRDLYQSTATSPGSRKQFALMRAEREEKSKAIRIQRGELAVRVRRLTDILDALGDRLACLPDDAPTGNAIARLFHLAVSRLRDTECSLRRFDERK